MNIYNRLEKTKWKRVWLDIPVYNDNVMDAMSSKELRCCPERFPELKQYEYVCWMDSKMKFTSWDNFKIMLDSMVSSDILVAATQHPLPYKTVWDEYETAINYEKYARQKEAYRTYIEELQKGANINMPQRICCGFRLMKMNDRRKELGEMWLQHIQKCGIEDQISWQFVHQFYENEIRIFPYQFCWSPI